MDLNIHSSKKFIQENLKNMKRFDEPLYDRVFPKEVTLPNRNRQLPKYSGYQPSEVLTFLSELTVNDPIYQETKFNLFLAEVLDAEYAFFIHKQNEKNCYLLRAIGDMKLQNDIKFTLPDESITSPNNDISEVIAANAVFRNAILDAIKMPIKNMKVFNVSPETNKIEYPFLFVLINKYSILRKNELSTESWIKSTQPKKILGEFSLEVITLIRSVMELLSPIFYTLLHDNDSDLLKWLPETSKRMKMQFDEQSAWLNHVTSLSKELLEEDKIKFHLADDIEKFFKNNPAAIMESSKFTKTYVIEISSNYDMIVQVDKGKGEDGSNVPLFYRKIVQKGYSLPPMKNTYCVPILVAGERLGIFEILRKESFISFEAMEKAHFLVIICAFGIMFRQLQQQEEDIEDYFM